MCSCTSSALVKLKTVTATRPRVTGDLQYGVFETDLSFGHVTLGVNQFTAPSHCVAIVPCICMPPGLRSA